MIGNFTSRCGLLDPQNQLPVAAMLALFVSCFFPAAAKSQVASLDGKEQNSTQESTLQQLIEPFAASVVRIRNSDRVCCLGAIVGDGLVISKRSELSGSLTIQAADGSQVSGVIIASNPYDDLALLQLSVPASDAESFSQVLNFEREQRVAAGDLLFSAGQQENPISIGVATVTPQAIPVKQPACRDCVDLGVNVSGGATEVEVEFAEREGEAAKTQNLRGAIIQRVYPRTIGERIGLLKGDLLVSINQRPVTDPMALRMIGSEVRVGQTLEIMVVRSGSVRTLTGKVDHFSRRVYHDRWGGGPFSERRFGFGTMIVHDSLLRPDQCGGPLIDLEGNLIGINIARSMRVATFAVPADRVVDFLNRVRPRSFSDFSWYSTE